MTVEYRLLGPLEVRIEGALCPLGGIKQRAVLALLLLHANRTVSRDQLIDMLWGETPPYTAVKAVQMHVSRLRKVLPPGALMTRPCGYTLSVETESVDLLRFEQLVARARRGRPSEAAQLLGAALELWRGSPLAEFGGESWIRLEAARLQDLRLVALEERIEADLELGRHHQLVGELEVLVASHPHQERYWGQLMLALYRAGRQAEALHVYRNLREGLGKLGLEPAPTVRRLERKILNQATELELRDRKRLAPKRSTERLLVLHVGVGREQAGAVLESLGRKGSRWRCNDDPFVESARRTGWGDRRIDRAVRELALEARFSAALPGEDASAQRSS